MLLSLQFFTANILGQFLDMLVSLLEKWTRAVLSVGNGVLANFTEFYSNMICFPFLLILHFFSQIFADFLSRRRHFSSIDSSAFR